MTGDPETSTAEEQVPARGAVRLTLDRQFGALFWGKLISGVGIWIHSIVAAVVVYAATGSALWVGLVSVVQFAPQIFLTPISGTWADRGNIVRQIVVGRVLCTVGSGSTAVFCYLRGDLEGHLDAAIVLAATLTTGLGFVVGGPAQQAIIPLLVRRSEFPTAMALNSLPMTLARVAGPAGGTFIAAQASPALAFALAALAHALFVVMVLLAALPGGTEHAANTDFRVRAALSYVRRDRTMFLLLIVVAAVGFGSEPSITLAPIIAVDLGGGTHLVGQLTGAFGLGAVAGFFGYRLLSRPIRQPHVLQIGLAAMILGTTLVALAPTAITALSAFAVTGAGFMIANTTAMNLVQLRVPPVMRGRVMALWMVGFVGSRPLASILEGILADAVSLTAALLVTAGVILAVFVAFRPKRLDFEAARL
ncbi:MFS transporter [Brevibacterium daeguense]|uniref:MFS transporter n=1 Tax=Brevibacterium daeguense TaxID=909936 RepID=A0ABP8EFF6_9MICO|nr:MFS transporter [Brevibacterium daeguense]